MHWAMGLKRLGHEVYFVEQVGPQWCVDDRGTCCAFEASINRQYFTRTMQSFGLAETSCQMYGADAADGATNGMSFRELIAAASGADLLINHSGHLTSAEVLRALKHRAYVDQDPVFTQLWRTQYGKDLNLGAHDVFFSVGQNIGTPHSPIPDGGITWHPVLPPVVPDYWPVSHADGSAPFTTVASLGGYGELQFQGEWFKPKYEELRRFAQLPRRVAHGMEIAVKGYNDDDPTIRLLRDGGWRVTNSRRFGDLDKYREFIAGSRGEIGIAKNAYVAGRSGWFSERSAQYLMSGKPVITQSTGFERVVPTGRGLLAFDTMQAAVDAVASVESDYESHCRAARTLAEETFDYRTVLPRMLETAMA
jgi:hypothetical protein